MKKLSKTSQDVLAAMLKGEKCCAHCAKLHEVLPRRGREAPGGWGDPEAGHGWVYLQDPRHVDYAQSLRVRVATIGLLRRENLIALDHGRTGANVNVPMRWYTLTDAGRAAAQTDTTKREG